MEAVTWQAPRDVQVCDVPDSSTGDDDPLDVEGLAIHVVPLEDAPEMYAAFQAKRDGAVTVLFEP